MATGRRVEGKDGLPVGGARGKGGQINQLRAMRLLNRDGGVRGVLRMFGGEGGREMVTGNSGKGGVRRASECECFANDGCGVLDASESCPPLPSVLSLSSHFVPTLFAPSAPSWSLFRSLPPIRLLHSPSLPPSFSLRLL
ncbi:hypothetical protein K438DRAFT_1983012 [Mycena galopus ATCC 62051]|nr:hypothetical protein K438DRAFT_1983012 [Mycena galopus ATCC 62051]